MAENVLNVEKLSVAYRTAEGGILALDRVNLHLNRGEIVGLVGETGSGKSTLARAVLGTLPKLQAEINSGSALLDGVDLVKGGEKARGLRGRKITLVPQDTYASLNPLFRIRTQIMDLMRSTSPRKPTWQFWRTRREYEAKLLAILEAVQLPHGHRILQLYPHQLSGGQRQRVMLALALLPNPQVIIADEPTSALDASTQVEILRLLRAVAVERDISILFTTHNLAAAWEVCDRIMVMHGGRIVEVAPRRTFFSSPFHPYTRTLLANASDPFGPPSDIGTDALDHIDVVKGCQFSLRCSRALPTCAECKPTLRTHRPNHQVACHNPSTSEAPFAYN